jgi:hypothetical protein
LRSTRRNSGIAPEGGIAIMKYFGCKYYDISIYMDIDQTSVPIGQPCRFCKKAIDARDDGFLIDRIPFHRACHLRQVIYLDSWKRRNRTEGVLVTLRRGVLRNNKGILF